MVQCPIVRSMPVALLLLRRPFRSGTERLPPHRAQAPDVLVLRCSGMRSREVLRQSAGVLRVPRLCRTQNAVRQSIRSENSIEPSDGEERSPAAASGLQSWRCSSLASVPHPFDNLPGILLAPSQDRIAADCATKREKLTGNGTARVTVARALHQMRAARFNLGPAPRQLPATRTQKLVDHRT